MMKNISKLIVVINWGLLVATAISFLILILGWFSLQCPCCCICRIDCEYTLKVSGALLTLWIASYQLAKYIDVETINSLAQLREMLNSEEKKKSIRRCSIPKTRSRFYLNCNLKILIGQWISPMPSFSIISGRSNWVRSWYGAE